MQVPAGRLFHPGLLRGPMLWFESRRQAQGLRQEAWKSGIWLFNHLELYDLIYTWIWLARHLGLPLGPDPVLGIAPSLSYGGGCCGSGHWLHQQEGGRLKAQQSTYVVSIT